MRMKNKIPVETYSRVVGYFRPVSQWNKGKKSEYLERNEWSYNDVLKALNEPICIQ